MGTLSINRSNIRIGRAKTGRSKATPKFRERNSFLNEEIAPICGSELHKDNPLVDEVSMSHLKRVVDAFLSKRHIASSYSLSGDTTKDVAILLGLVDKNIDDEEKVEICRINGAIWEKGRPEFVVYRKSEFDTWNFFILPICILDYVADGLRDIIKKFFAYMWLRSPFNFDEEGGLLNYTLGIDYWDGDGKPVFIEDDDDDADSSFYHWKKRYIYGDIRDYFNEIESLANEYRNDVDSLIKEIRDSIQKSREHRFYTSYTINGKEHEVEDLFVQIEKGLDLMNGDDSIFSHYIFCVQNDLGDDFEDEELDDDGSVDLSNLFVFGYENTENDPIIESTFDALNNGSEGPPSSLVLYKVLDETGECDLSRDYPKEWETWFNEFYKTIYE